MRVTWRAISGHFRREEVLIKVKTSIFRFMSRKLPAWKSVDYLIAYFLFLYFHRRPPKKTRLFNDYIFFLKISRDNLALRSFVADKEFLKIFVRSEVGQKFNVPTLALIKKSSEILTAKFFKDCCIKPTHLSGPVLFRRNGSEVDRGIIESWMKQSHYQSSREPAYQSLEPKIIVEPLIFNSTDNIDYKIFCFSGKAKLIQIDLGRWDNHVRLYYSRDWKLQPFSILKPQAKKQIQRPVNLNEMLWLAEELAKHFNFIRIDLYTDENQIFVGELTSYHGSGLEPFMPLESEKLASEIIFGSYEGDDKSYGDS